MIPGKADTAGVDAMSDNILWKRIGRMASPLVASQVALSRAFDQLLPRSFRVDGSKDFNSASFRDTCVRHVSPRGIPRRACAVASTL
jgi:hypothetical protein